MKNAKSLRPPKSEQERTAKLEKELHPMIGLPQAVDLPTEAVMDQASEALPNSQMGRAQSEFMKPEHADRNSNKKSGAI